MWMLKMIRRLVDKNRGNMVGLPPAEDPIPVVGNGFACIINIIYY